MKVSAKVEYACIALMELAVNHGDGHPVRIKAIAEAHDIPPRFLVQILLLLKNAGLVASVRGASGGYQLARSPQHVSLADVFSAFEEKERAPTLSAKLKPSAPARALLAVWSELQAEQKRLLENVTLAELLQRSREDSANLSYQI